MVELALASFVLRHKLPINAPETLTTLLSDFLIADISVARACEVSRIGSLELLNLVWSRSERGVTSTLRNLLKTTGDYYEWEFSEALLQTVKKADLSMIHWLLSHFSRCPVSTKVVREAAKGGQLWVLQLLEADQSHGGIQWRKGRKAKCLTDAARAGHWDLMKWLDKRASTEDTRDSNFGLFEIAVQDNDMEKVKWVINNGFAKATIDHKGCPDERWEDRIQLLRYLLERGHGDSSMIVDYTLLQAARLGDLTTMKWLVARNEAFYDDDVYDIVLYKACEHGHLLMVQWILENIDHLGQVDGPSDAMFAAAKYGRLDIVRWLWEHFSRDPTVTLFKNCGVSLTSPCTAMDAAAESGHIEVFQYLDGIDGEARERTKERAAKRQCQRDRYPRCTSLAMDSAAANGRLDVVKWLHAYRSEGCTTAAMDNAAASGHLKVVQWLHWNRSEGTSDAMDKTAAKRFHLASCTNTKTDTCYLTKVPNAFYETQVAILSWLYRVRYEKCTAAAMDGAAANGNLKVMKWLRENMHTPTTTKAMDEAAGIGRLDIVQWLHEQQWIDCTAAMDNAAAGGHLNVVQWLHANRSEGCTANAMNLAAANGHLGVVRWLLANRRESAIIPAMEHAIVCKNFEIMWYLDAQRIDYTVTLREMRDRLRGRNLYQLTHDIFDRIWEDQAELVVVVGLLVEC